MTWLVMMVAFGAVAALSAAGTRMVLAILHRRAILDHPNQRSSHVTPTPRGGGLAVLAVLLPSWILIGVVLPDVGDGLWLVVIPALILAGLSWLDDLRDLSALLRFGVQIAAVSVGMLSMPTDMPVFQGLLPTSLDMLIAAILWLWFLNLFNFMDGIDGIAGIEAICICGGLVGLALIDSNVESMLLPLTLAATVLGFLVWNWPPARIFLGDVGSVPLGFLIGWLLLSAAAQGDWAVALILPLYYLADSSITLTRRMLRGERIWQAHAEHFYQRAVQHGLGHRMVVCRILLANLLLIALAIATAVEGAYRLPASIMAVLVVSLLLRWLSGNRRTAGHS